MTHACIALILFAPLHQELDIMTDGRYLYSDWAIEGDELIINGPIEAFCSQVFRYEK